MAKCAERREKHLHDLAVAVCAHGKQVVGIDGSPILADSSLLMIGRERERERREERRERRERGERREERREMRERKGVCAEYRKTCSLKTERNKKKQTTPVGL
jgi:hypothetical protein